jgi:hypothetical protein
MKERISKTQIWRACLTTICALLLAATLFNANPLTRSAENYSQNVLASAITIYASLRAINAFLSTAQEIEVGASFVASGSIQPLKALEPLDDTVESVAKVVLSVTIIASVLVIGISPVASLGYALVIASWIALFFGPLRSSATAGFRLGLFVGILLPIALIAGGQLGDFVTENVLEKHQVLLADITNDLTLKGDEPTDSNGPPTTDLNESLITKLLSRVEGIGQSARAMTNATGETLSRIDDYTRAAGTLVERSDDLLRSYVNIIAVYVLKSVVLPSIVLWLLFVVARRERVPA